MGESMQPSDSGRRGARQVTLFLDVDGVLNSYPVTGLRFLRERRRRVRAWRYELHFRPRVVRFLERLTRQREVELVWLSTWSTRCRSDIEPKLGFRSHHRIIPMPDASYNLFADDPQRWWKAQAVDDWFAAHPDGRAIWIDDDLTAPATREHFTSRYGERLLMIAPDFTRGLGEEHFREIRAFTCRRAVPARPRRSILATKRTPAAGARAAEASTEAPAGIGTTHHGKA